MTAEAVRATDVPRQAILRAVRDPMSLLDLGVGDLDLTLRLLRRARLLGRVAARLEEQGVLDRLGPVAADLLRGGLALADARVRAARWELDRISTALAGLAGLEVVALKGCAYLISGLPNAVGRTFADVDLMVALDDLPRVEARLRERGWESKPLTPYDDAYYRDWAHEIPPLVHVERDVELDLHHGILMRTARLRPPPSLLQRAARAVPGSRFRVLAPVDMVLHAMTHLFFGGETDDAVRELVDIDELLRHFGAREPGFWTGLWPRARELGLERAAFYGLRQSSRWLGTPVPDVAADVPASAAPPALVTQCMDSLLPLSLFPMHPDRPAGAARPARLALFCRAHWVRMPPVMLARHLAHKFYVTRLRPSAGGPV